VNSERKNQKVSFEEAFPNEDEELRPKKKKQKVSYVVESDVEESSYVSSEEDEEEVAKRERERQFRLATNYDEDGNCLNEVNPDIEVLEASEEGDFIDETIEQLRIPSGRFTKVIEHIYISKEHEEDNPFEGATYSEKVSLSSGVKDLAVFLNQQKSFD